MKEVVLCFSGRIGSGKTTTSSKIADILHWKYSSFGKIIRDEAVRRGLNYQSRTILQEIGKELMNLGWVEFCKTVLDDVDWKYGEGLVIDGIRHFEAISTLKNLVYPTPIYLIHISIENDERYKRLEARGSLNNENFSIFDKDETEAQVIEILPSHADLIINGTLSSEVLVSEVTRWLNSQ